MTDVTIQNKMVIEERDVNIYHHADKSSYRLSHDSSVKITLKQSIHDDYLHLSLASGPGNIVNRCLVDLPVWLDYEFIEMEGKFSVKRSSDRTLIKIQPGMPVWQLKLTQSASLFNWKRNHVIISEDT